VKKLEKTRACCEVRHGGVYINGVNVAEKEKTKEQEKQKKTNDAKVKKEEN